MGDVNTIKVLRRSKSRKLELKPTVFRPQFYKVELKDTTAEEIAAADGEDRERNDEAVN